MVAVVGGQGAQAVRGQELVLVEQLGEQLLEPADAGQAEQQPPLAGLTPHQSDLAGLFRVGQATTVHEVRERLAGGERQLDVVLLQHRGGQNRDDAHHRPDLDRGGVPVGREQPVVEEPVGLVPQPEAFQGLADAGEVLHELEHEVDAGPLAGPVQDDRQGGHGDRVERHPAGGVGLLQRAADRQVRAVDRADVVQAEEAALEQVVALGVFAVDPPGEVDQQLVEDPAEEVDVAGRRRSRTPQPRPRPAPAGSRRRSPTRRRAARRWGAGTTPGTAGSAGTWRTPGRRGPGRRSGRPGPRRRTRGTPTCPAST